MKAISNRKGLWLSAVSLFITILFMLMAGGSIGEELREMLYLPKINRILLGDGKTWEIASYKDNFSCTEKEWRIEKTGYYDEAGRWHGDYTEDYFEIDHNGERQVSRIEGRMRHGLRDGEFKFYSTGGVITY